jgi:hypothetical protein
MASMPYRPRYVRQAHRAAMRSAHDELAPVRSHLAEVDRVANAADARGRHIFVMMQDLTAEVRERCGIDPPPCYEVSDAELADANLMPAGHPEALRPLPDEGAEAELVLYGIEMWPHDEYSEIVAEDFRQRNGGTS